MAMKENFRGKNSHYYEWRTGEHYVGHIENYLR